LDAIKKKLTWGKLNYDEIFTIIKDISENRISDTLITYYVASSFAYETTNEEMYLTAKAMADTGVEFKWDGIVADKHCIWWVPGNETSMIMIPLLASLGIKMPKNFSKSITSPAATGECVGVLMDISFNKKEIEQLVKKNNCCLVWWGGLELAPADDKIIRVSYPLSMQNIAKVVSSIMAKKYAMGINHSLIDIPIGPSAKVKDRKEAKIWKEKFEYVGKKLGMKVHVAITHAEQPIGNGIGAELQVREVLRVLQQHPKRPKDLEDKAIELSAKIIEMIGMAKGKKAEEIARKQIINGAAWKKMQEIIKAQHGKNPSIKSEVLVAGKFTYDVLSTKSGKIQSIDMKDLNMLARTLGCPYENKAGCYLQKKLGDKVKKGETLFTMYATDDNRINLWVQFLKTKPVYTVK
jgi:thymidine phosphorylase